MIQSNFVQGLAIEIIIINFEKENKYDQIESSKFSIRSSAFAVERMGYRDNITA